MRLRAESFASNRCLWIPCKDQCKRRKLQHTFHRIEVVLPVRIFFHTLMELFSLAWQLTLEDRYQINSQVKTGSMLFDWGSWKLQPLCLPWEYDWALDWMIRKCLQCFSNPFTQISFGYRWFSVCFALILSTVPLCHKRYHLRHSSLHLWVCQHFR